MSFHWITLYAALLLLTAPLAAQEEPVPAEAGIAFEGTLPDSVVVTASRLSEDARLTGRRISVWTAHDLEHLPVSSFDELLRTVGGIEVQSRGGFGTQSDLTMRGSGFSGVLVLVDGARLNDPMTGHFLTDFPVPRSEIARIEVLRGPATALYGPDAIGGVVHVITRVGLRDAGTSATGRGEDAAIRVGRNGLVHVEARVGQSWKRSGFHLAGEWLRTNGESIRNLEGVPVVDAAGDPVRTDLDRFTATTALTHSLPGADLYARIGVDNRDFGAYHYYTAFESDTAREATATYWLQARLRSRPESRTQWTVQLAGKQHEDEYVFNPQVPANTHTSRLATLQAYASRTLSPTISLTGGVSAEARGIESNNMGEHSDAAAGAFATARWQPAVPLTLTLSGRLDADPGYGVEVTPQASIAYNQAIWTLRAAAGRAVRAPSYVERYFNTTLDNPRGSNLGNPDLNAERSWTLEAGADVYPAPGVSLHATAFSRSTRDLIDYALLTPTDTVWLARNLHQVDTRGLELDASVNRSLSRHAILHLNASYTFLDADLGVVEEGVEYKYALTNARHLAQGTATLTVDRWSLGAQALWKDRIEADSYGTVHAKVGYTLPIFEDRLAASVQVRNLFDAQYTDVFDAPMPGRWWIVGLRLR